MYKLSEMLDSPDSLAQKLKANGESHINYKMYTSMEKALEFALTGNIYLSDGSVWNDKTDRELMKEKMVFAKSMSYSTRENVAMWMLYGAECGRNGAAINLTRGAIHEALTSTKVSLVKIDKTGVHILRSLSKSDYEIFMTDMIYVDPKGVGCCITYNKNNAEIENDSILNHRDVFHKRYEWKYENEVRMVVKLKNQELQDLIWKKVEEQKNTEVKDNQDKFYYAVCVNISKKYRADEERIIRSPIYKGSVFYGTASSLTGDVDWNL